MEVSDPLGFVRDYQCLLTDRVLSGYARGAMTGVARLRLNTAERKHEAARAVAPVSAHGDHTRHVKCADDFSAGTNANLVTNAQSHQRVVDQAQAILQRHAHVVRKFHRGCAGAAFRPINHNEVRVDAAGVHRFGDGKPFPRMAHAKFETNGFATAQFTQLRDELHQLCRGGKCAVTRR